MYNDIRTYIHTHTHTYTHIYIYIYKCIHVYIHIYAYIFIHMYTYTHTHTYIYIYIYTHAHTYIYTYTYIYIYIYIYRYLWRNDYRRRHEFKSCTSLYVFQIALIPLGKVEIQLFSFQLLVNSRADRFHQPWLRNQSRRRKNLNSKPVKLRLKLSLCHILPAWRGW